MEDKKSFGEQMVNPVLKSALKDQTVAENCATYKSIFKKTGLFLLVVLIGVAAAILIHLMVGGTPISGVKPAVTMSVLEAVLLIIFALLAFIMPIVASFWTNGAAVCGSLACIAYGYILGFMAVGIEGYQGPILLALAITIALVSALVCLYRFRVIKVSNKFVSIVSILFFTMFLASFLLLICYFIPGLSGFVKSLWNNPVLSIGFGVLGVILGCLFLLCDFKAIENAVENKVDKKYENRLAFGLAFSVIWLYFKILELILRILAVVKK